MSSDLRPKRRDYSRLHLGMSHVAFIGAVSLVAAVTFDLPGWVGFIGVIAMVVAIVTMFFTRDSDEYIAGLWQSGANAGFVAAVAFLVLAPFLEGMIDGLLNRPHGQDWQSDSAGIIAVIVFLIVFNWKRHFGTA